MSERTVYYQVIVGDKPENTKVMETFGLFDTPEAMASLMSELDKKYGVYRLEKVEVNVMVPESILEISERMNSQNHRGTMHPLFMIVDEEGRYVEGHGMFFTEEAIENYMRSRSYEIPSGARSYAIGNYYSEEMKAVMDFLSWITNDGLPHPNYQWYSRKKD